MHQSATYQDISMWKPEKLKHDIEVHSIISGTIHGPNCKISDNEADVEAVEDSTIRSL